MSVSSRCHQINSLSCFVLSEKGQVKDKNPEEMNRLRDQLVSTFKEQMDIRLAMEILHKTDLLKIRVRIAALFFVKAVLIIFEPVPVQYSFLSIFRHRHEHFV